MEAGVTVESTITQSDEVNGFATVPAESTQAPEGCSWCRYRENKPRSGSCRKISGPSIRCRRRYFYVLMSRGDASDAILSAVPNPCSRPKVEEHPERFLWFGLRSMH